MPILIMAFVALAVFLVMGGMLFYASYAEHKTYHRMIESKHAEHAPEIKTHAHAG